MTREATFFSAVRPIFTRLVSPDSEAASADLGARASRRENTPPSQASNNASSEWPIFTKFSVEPPPHALNWFPLFDVQTCAAPCHCL